MVGRFQFPEGGYSLFDFCASQIKTVRDVTKSYPFFSVQNVHHFPDFGVGLLLKHMDKLENKGISNGDGTLPLRFSVSLVPPLFEPYLQTP